MLILFWIFSQGLKLCLLLKINKFPYHFEETLDLSAEIESVEDIYEIGPVNITGSINRLDDEKYELPNDEESYIKTILSKFMFIVII